MPSEMVIASKFRNAQYFEENELRVTHEKKNKQTNKQTYKKQYNYLLQSLEEVCLIFEVTMKTADSFSQSSTFNQESTVPEFSDWWSRTCR